MSKHNDEPQENPLEDFQGHDWSRGWTKLPNEFVDHHMKHLTTSEIAVMILLFRETKGWEKASVRIGLRRMAEIIGLSVDTVSRATASLEKKKLLQVGRRKTAGGANVRNTYTIPEATKAVPTDGTGVGQEIGQPVPVDGTQLSQSLGHGKEVDSEGRKTSARAQERDASVNKKKRTGDGMSHGAESEKQGQRQDESSEGMSWDQLLDKLRREKSEGRILVDSGYITIQVAGWFQDNGRVEIDGDRQAREADLHEQAAAGDLSYPRRHIPEMARIDHTKWLEERVADLVGKAEAWLHDR